EYAAAVGPQDEHIFDKASEPIGRLVRQSVNQIDVDALKTQPARSGDQFRSHLQRLDTLDRTLHLRIEILNAHAQAIKAEAPQRFQVLNASDARIHFNPNFRIGRKGEFLCGETEQ